MKGEYYAGKGCRCCASSAFECGCEGVDWTDPEVYRLRKEITKLRAALLRWHRLAERGLDDVVPEFMRPVVRSIVTETETALQLPGKDKTNEN